MQVSFNLLTSQTKKANDKEVESLNEHISSLHSAVMDSSGATDPEAIKAMESKRDTIRRCAYRSCSMEVYLTRCTSQLAESSIERKDEPRWWEVMVDYICAKDIRGDLNFKAEQVKQALEVYKAWIVWWHL